MLKRVHPRTRVVLAAKPTGSVERTRTNTPREQSRNSEQGEESIVVGLVHMDQSFRYFFNTGHSENVNDFRKSGKKKSSSQQKRNGGVVWADPAANLKSNAASICTR